MWSINSVTYTADHFAKMDTDDDQELALGFCIFCISWLWSMPMVAYRVIIALLGDLYEGVVQARLCSRLQGCVLTIAWHISSTSSLVSHHCYRLGSSTILYVPPFCLIFGGMAQAKLCLGQLLILPFTHHCLTHFFYFFFGFSSLLLSWLRYDSLFTTFNLVFEESA